MPDDRSPHAPADFTHCDREAIHVPGSIQPHGVLLAFLEPSLEIVSVSANAQAAFGLDAEELTGLALAAVLDVDAVERVARPANRDDVGLDGLDAIPLTTRLDGTPRHWTGLVHRHGGLGILELEPLPAPRAGPGTTLLLSAASQRLQNAAGLVEACQVVVEQIRRITGFARVKLYRFASDWSGEVLAESRDDDMPSYLGLHFPASDIPAQARALYRSNPVRVITDVHYTPSPLRPDRDPTTGGPIDLSFATLRSVSPVHLEYLRNMGTGASMSVSILRNGELWGLIACHHREPLLVDLERRQGAVLLARLLAARLDGQDRTERARHSGRVESLRADMLRSMADGQSVTEALEGQRDAWTRLVDAGGFALVRPGLTVPAHPSPDAAFLHRLTDWLAANSSADHVATDRLGARFAPAADAPVVAIASGLLAVPLSRIENSYLLWFRPERLQTVTWAGRPAKTEVPLPTGTVLHPRASFDAWTEQVRGRSDPWTEQEISTALQLRELLLDLTVREKGELERQNVRLSLSARELETFLYVASHDIKEPLRQMEMLASLLRAHVRDDAEAEVAGYFREFRTVATRLRSLTDQLAGYARIGRVDAPRKPVALDDLVEEVLASLQGAVDETGCVVEVAPLPVVLGERDPLHQVFINLIGNALKYRATNRTPRVSVRADALPFDADRIARRMARIVIADNGIGFDARFGEKVFEPFARLHSRDRYEGSGIGLAICRRIVERHDGRIAVEAAPDVGATFTFTLPLAGEPGNP